MEIGTEISHKIRSAIKSKLMELGAYVDEELPDYIMVMVANKKSQSAMTEDLNLFLGGNTEKFTGWLQNLLVKLQSISVASKKKESDEKASKAAKEAAEKEKKSSKTSHRKSTEKPEKSSPPVKSKETVTKAQKPSQIVKEKPREKAPVAAASATAKAHKSTTKTTQISTTHKETEVQPERTSPQSLSPKVAEVVVSKTAEPEAIPHEEAEEKEEQVSDGNQGEEPTPVTVVTEVAKEEEEPEFTVKAEYDEFSEEFSQEAEKAALAEEAKKRASKVKPTTPSSTGQSSEQDTGARKTTTVFARISPVAASAPPTEQVVVRSSPISSRLGAVPQISQVAAAGHRSSSSRRVSIQESSDHKDQTESSRDPPRRAISGSILGVKRRMPGSVVGTVSLKSRRLVEEAEDEEYDPLNPAVGNVASTIKVSARRSSVPRRLQANKSLLMKAVDEATKSVSRNKAAATGSAYIPLGRTVERVPSKSRTLFTRSKRDEIMRSLKREVLQQPSADPVRRGVITKVDRHEASSEEDMEEPVMEPEEAPVLVTRVPQAAPAYKVVEVMEEGDYPADYTDDNRRVHVEGSYKQEEPEGEGLDMEEAADVIQLQDDGQLSPQMETEGDEEEEEEMFVVKAEPVVKEEPKDPIIAYKPTQLALPRAELKPTLREYAKVDPRPTKRLVQQDKPSEVADKTRFIVTLDGVDPLKFDAKDPPADVDDTSSVTSGSNVGSVVPIVHVLPKRQKVETVSINLTGSDAENDDDDDTSMEVTANKKTEKCKFWPACANGNQCSYHHPCTPCRSFPHCKFGDKCLYIHPNCKYDAKCTKPDCPFTHASKRSAGVKQPIPQYISLPPQATAVLYPVAAANSIRPNLNPTKPKCKFFPKCTNMSCPFSHPKPCRYGMSCANKATCPFHHPALPGKDQFRWSSSGASTKPDHISERKFDQGLVTPVSTSKT